MVLSACTTPVLDTDAASMDTDDTASTLPADNVPGSFRILPSSGSSKQTFEQTPGADYHWGNIRSFYALTGGQGAMVVYNRSLICSAPEDAALVHTVLSCLVINLLIYFLSTRPRFS